MKAIAMANPSDVRDSARRKANNHFTAAEARDTLVKQELQKERAAFETKTAKLKALRLAKEAADALEEERLAMIKAAAKALPKNRALPKNKALPKKTVAKKSPPKKAAAPSARKPAARAAKRRGA